MSRASSLLKRIDGVLNKLNPNDRVVYKRVVGRSGGDVLIGRPAQVIKSDTKLVPQPSVTYLPSTFNTMVAGPSTLMTDASVYCLVSANAMSREDIVDPSVSLVFVDAEGGEEQYTISGCDPYALEGVAVAYNLALTSKSRKEASL